MAAILGVMLRKGRHKYVAIFPSEGGDIGKICSCLGRWAFDAHFNLTAHDAVDMIHIIRQMRQRETQKESK